MSEHCHDASDMRLLKEMRKLAPKDYEAWFGLNAIVGREDGAIPRKYREFDCDCRLRDHAVSVLPRGAREGGESGCDARRGGGGGAAGRGVARRRAGDARNARAQILRSMSKSGQSPSAPSTPNKIILGDLRGLCVVRHHVDRRARRDRRAKDCIVGKANLLPDVCT